MSLFKKSKPKAKSPVEYKFYSSLSPNEAIQNLKDWNADDIQLGSFESLDNGFRFDMEVKAGQVTMLAIEGYLYEISKMDGNSDTHVKLVWKNEKDWFDSFELDSQSSGGLVIVGIIGLILINPILENMGINVLEAFASFPVVRGQAFLFPLLCLGAIGGGILILGTFILNRIIGKYPAKITEPGNIWADFKLRLMTRLRTPLR